MPKKTQAKWIRSTWVGLTERTGEHRVVSKTGKAFKVRSVKRLPEQLRWNQAAIEAIRATPRHPDPDNVKITEIRPATEEDVAGPEVVDEVQEVLDPLADDTQAVPRAGRGADTRELKITKRLLNKFGYSDNCAGCFHSRQNLPQRAHTPECRTRIYMAMQDDDDERERLGRVLDRMVTQPEAAEPLIEDFLQPQDETNETPASKIAEENLGEL